MRSYFPGILVSMLAVGICLNDVIPTGATDDNDLIVNGIQITDERIARRTRLLKLTGQELTNKAEQAARDELIAEVPSKEIIRRANIGVSNRQVDEAYSSIAKRVNLSTKNLSATLRQSGIQPETVKEW